MNKEQKQKIKVLRANGLGYKKIAKVMNLSKETIHTFCRRNEIAGYAKNLHLCKCCGVKLEITNNTKPRMFCSNSCKDKHRYLMKKEVRNGQDLGKRD